MRTVEREVRRPTFLALSRVVQRSGCSERWVMDRAIRGKVEVEDIPGEKLRYSLESVLQQKREEERRQ
jgi:hypothetical protein